MVEKVTAGATSAMGSIKMQGYDPHNIQSDITTSVSTGATLGQTKQPAMLKEVKSVSSPSNDSTPSYTFSSNKPGSITYGSGSSSSVTVANVVNNTIEFNTLGDGTYSNCTIRVVDNLSNISSPLRISIFKIEAKVPTVSSTIPEDGSSSVLVNSSISVTFSEAMDLSSITTNTSDSLCSGTFQGSSNNFSSCIQMTSPPSVSNLQKTFTIIPSSAFLYSKTYQIQITLAVKANSLKNIGSSHISSIGFTTETISTATTGTTGS